MGAEMNEREALKLALEALENNKKKHDYCEDTWYSCPKHEDGCANDSEGDECNCGADNVNAQFDKAIIAIKEALAQPEFVLNGIDCSCGRKWRVVNNTLTASEQPEQEPVAWQVKYRDDEGIPQIAWFPHPVHSKSPLAKRPYTEEPLYTTPPQRKPLSDEQIDEIYFKSSLEVNSRCEDIYDFVRAIEAAHGIKKD